MAASSCLLWDKGEYPFRPTRRGWDKGEYPFRPTRRGWDKGEYPFRPKGVLHEEGNLPVSHRNKRFPPAVYLVFCGTMSTYLHD